MVGYVQEQLTEDGTNVWRGQQQLGGQEEINRPDGVRELMRQNSEKLPESFTDGEGKTTRYEYGAFDLL
ncbi:hypothetical protein, partial [Citrobacter portucalensis]|uniref:hypothetical protein n=1 Tax=Citrobacter portucalensis TaxID=1639133 RepID=UPI00226B2FE4